jgi:hypothetical protein
LEALGAVDRWNALRWDGLPGTVKIPTGSDQRQILLLIFKARMPQKDAFTAHEGIDSGLSHASSLPKGTTQRTGKLRS